MRKPHLLRSFGIYGRHNGRRDHLIIGGEFALGDPLVWEEHFFPGA